MEKAILALGILVLLGSIYNLNDQKDVELKSKFNAYKIRFNK